MKNKKISKPIFIYSIITAALAAILAIARTAVLASVYQADMFVYANGTSAGQILDIIIGVAVVAMAIAAMFTVKKGTAPQKLPCADGVTSFSAFLAGFLMLANIVWSFIENKFTFSTSTPDGILNIIATACGILSALYFIATALKKDMYMKNSLAVGFGVALWAMFTLMASYFSYETPMSSPTRIINQVVLLAVMLYFVNELRFLLGRPKVQSFLAMGSAAVILLSVTSLPSLVLIYLKKWDMINSQIYFFLCLALAVYTVSRMFSLSVAEVAEAENTAADTDSALEDTSESE